MFAKWGSAAHRHRWGVLVATGLLAVLGGVWGLGVFDRLGEGGYEDPSSEAVRAGEVAEEAFGRQDGDVIVIYGGDFTSAREVKKIADHVGGFPRSKMLKVVGPVLSDDKRQALVAITLNGNGSNELLKLFGEVEPQLPADGFSAHVGGLLPTQKAINDLSREDLVRAEATSLPLVLLLLVIILGGLVAASLPVVVGGLAIMGSLGVLHAVAIVTEVNSFAVNVASLLGLGMAIDYGLFTVGRFREELASGRTTGQAVVRTVASAGRTVVFSATLLVVALAGLLLFPQTFLKSIAYGGMSAVAIAALVSITVLPALLGVLGHRVDKLAVPWRTKEPSERGWRKLGAGVMKRPLLVALPLIGLLIALGAPFLGVQFGQVTEKVLPEGSSARVAVENVNQNFPALASTGLKIVIRGGDQEAVQDYLDEVAAVPGIAAIRPAGTDAGVTAVSAGLAHDVLSDESKQALKDVRALTPPSGAEVLVGGDTAIVSDSLQAIADGLPLMIGLLVGATLILMFLAFGSVVVPIKAVVMSAVSLSATFGVLVWIFQDGHGAALLGVTPGPLESSVVLLMGAIVFGLSTDYEVFLLSRVAEARGRGAGTEEAVVTGMAKTGRVITSAALLLILVTGAFSFSQVALMRFVGVGMIIALALDATVVRMLLVPALLKLMDYATWWAPGPLKRIQERLVPHDEPADDREDRAVVRDSPAVPARYVPLPAAAGRFPAG